MIGPVVSLATGDFIMGSDIGTVASTFTWSGNGRGDTPKEVGRGKVRASRHFNYRLYGPVGAPIKFTRSCKLACSWQFPLADRFSVVCTRGKILRRTNELIGSGASTREYWLCYSSHKDRGRKADETTLESGIVAFRGLGETDKTCMSVIRQCA